MRRPGDPQRQRFCSITITALLLFGMALVALHGVSMVAGAAAPPTVTSITPDSARSGASVVRVTRLSGTGFLDGATAKLTMGGQPDINATGVVVSSSRKITCSLNLTGAAPGARNVIVTNPDGQSGILPGVFTVLPPLPTISSITPDNAGSGNPGVSITDLSGANFASGVSVRLTRGGQADIIASNVSVVSPARITCTLDLTGVRQGGWSVVVTNPDGGSATARNGFTVNRAPGVASVTPDKAPTGNPSVSMRIRGGNFSPGASVKLTRPGCPDIEATDVQAPRPSRITCTFDLTDAAAGARDVHVANPDGGRGVLQAGFTVTSNPTITSITPDNAGSGNSSVASVIAGANFSPGATAKLTMGGRTIQASTIDVVSSSMITCTFDLTGAAPGSWDVHVTNPDGGIATLRRVFTVKRPPGVTAVTPNSAPGGKASVPVTVTGSRFAPGAGVRLARTGQSDIIATEVTVVSSNTITCTLDLTDAAAGARDVVVTNPDGGRGSLSAGFTVTPGPTVTSITPGSARTGTTVPVGDLAGTDFASGALVKLTREGQADIQATDVTVVSPEKITCTLDLTGAAAGAWNVHVTNTDGGSGSLGGGFAVDPLPAPVVSAVVPDYANSDEGTVPATVQGADFVSGASLRLAMSGQPEINATDVTVVSTTEITCTLDISSAASGAWDVIVTNPDGQSGVLPGGFTVNPAPTVDSINPASAGSGASEVRVTINGAHLDRATSVRLTRGGLPDITASNLAINSSTEISCLLDLSSAEPGAWDVVVTNTWGGAGALPNGFTVNPPPSVSSITPSEGVAGELLEVEIGGAGFAQGASVKITREGQTDITATEVTVVSPTRITCTLDLAEAQPGPWSVVATNPDGGIGRLTDGFTVLPAHTLTSIEVTPANATVDHGSTLQFTARGLDQHGGELPITPEWSADPGVGTITPEGLFTASGYGTCEVRATVGTISNYALVQVPSYIGGAYGENLTLEKKYNPWILTHDLRMHATLTIEPGVVIKAMPNARPAILVYGFLDAEGTYREPIKMTSCNDDTIFGDTNNDGFSDGARGDWTGITFLNNLRPPALAYVYSYYAQTAYNNSSSASPVLTNCKGNDTGAYGFLTYGGAPQVSGCTFDNGRDGVHVTGASSINMAGCAISDMSSNGVFADTRAPFAVDGNSFERCGYGIRIADGVLFSAITDNTINDCTNVAIHLGASAPDNVRNNRGTGNAVNGIRVAGVYGRDAVWNGTNCDPETGAGLPWTIDVLGWYHPTFGGSSLVIAKDATLTIEAGAVVKTKQVWDHTYIGWAVAGRVITRGTAGNPVTITSIKDDTVWGDTDNNGPHPGDLKNDSIGLSLGWWGGASSQGVDLNHTVFRCVKTGVHGSTPAGYESTVRNCVFRKCGAAFNIGGGNFTIGDPDAAGHNSVVIEDCDNGGRLGGAAGDRSRVTRSTIRNLPGYGLTVSSAGAVTVDGNNIENCAGTGIDIGSCGGGSVVSSNLIERCGYGIKVAGCGAMTTIASNTVNDCAGFLGMVSGGLENLDIYDNGGSGCKANGIELDYDWGNVHHFILKKNDVPYTITRRDVTISRGSVLELRAGVVMKFLNRGIVVDGALDTADSPIPGGKHAVMFTSLYDNADGTRAAAGTPRSTDWNGILFNSGCEVDDRCFSNWYLGFGHGIWIKGSRNQIALSNSFLTDCQYGIRWDFDTWDSSSTESKHPNINDCAILRCTYGVYVGQTPWNLEKNPARMGANPPIINAQNNYWALEGRIQNGPGPAGDGSRVNNFDLVDVLPWKGLGQNHEQDEKNVDGVETRPEVGTVCRVFYPPGANAACSSFANVFRNSGVDVRQEKGNEDVGDVLRGGERDMRNYFGASNTDPKWKGQDPLSFDNVDLAFFAGHGHVEATNTSTMKFARREAQDDYRCGEKLASDQIAWGDQDLEWAIVYNCRFMARASQADAGMDRGRVPGVPPPGASYEPDDFTNEIELSARLKPQTVDKGLHMVLGFGTQAYMVGALGEKMAQYINRPADPMSVKFSWFIASNETQPVDRRNEDQLWRQNSIWDVNNLAVAYGAADCEGDFFWGRGPVQKTDPNMGSPEFFRTWECDAPEGETIDFPAGELPKASRTIIDASGTYETRPGRTEVFEAAGGWGTWWNEPIIVRFRAVNATGTRKYVETQGTIIPDNPSAIRVVTPALAPGSYQVLFLNNNMQFGYLERDLVVPEPEPPQP